MKVLAQALTPPQLVIPQQIRPHYYPCPRWKLAAERVGIPVLANGAFTPGAVDRNSPSLGADWYFGNLQKLAVAPKGRGFLKAAPERQKDLHPTILSWGFGQGFNQEYDWVGTKDPTPDLSVPAALALMLDGV